MKHRLLEGLRGIRIGHCALIVAMLLIPYLVDVAYYGDLTPTHFAQENLQVEDVDSSDATKSLSSSGGHAYPEQASCVRPVDDVTACSPAKTVFAPPNLFVASFTSRPPPTL